MVYSDRVEFELVSLIISSHHLDYIDERDQCLYPIDLVQYRFEQLLEFDYTKQSISEFNGKDSNKKEFYSFVSIDCLFA